MILRFALCLFALTLCGCGPSAKQLVEQQSRHEFNQAVAAMKVSTTSATYQEFREKRLALETCYSANQNALAVTAGSFDCLDQLMKATDELWSMDIYIKTQFPEQFHAEPNLNFFAEPAMKSAWSKDMETILFVSTYTQEQMKSFGSFPNNYVRVGLTLISHQCDVLLQTPTN